jgi:hypothetical protein
MGGPRIYPTEKQKILDSLTEKQIQIMQKDYPFKKERDSIIYELRQRGVACSLLAELSGLTKTSTHRIGSHRPALIKNKQSKELTLAKVSQAFNAFYTELERILLEEGKAQRP